MCPRRRCESPVPAVVSSDRRRSSRKRGDHGVGAAQLAVVAPAARRSSSSAVVVATPTSARSRASSRSSHASSSTDDRLRSDRTYPENSPRVLPIRSRSSAEQAPTVGLGLLGASLDRRRLDLDRGRAGGRRDGACGARAWVSTCGRAVAVAAPLTRRPRRRRGTATTRPTTTVARTTARTIQRASMASEPNGVAGADGASGDRPSEANPVAYTGVVAGSASEGSRRTFWLTTLDEPPGVMVTP